MDWLKQATGLWDGDDTRNQAIKTETMINADGTISYDAGGYGWVSEEEYRELEKAGKFRLGQQAWDSGVRAITSTAQAAYGLLPDQVEGQIEQGVSSAISNVGKGYSNLPLVVRKGIGGKEGVPSNYGLEGLGRTALAPFQAADAVLEGVSKATNIGKGPLEGALTAAEIALSGGTSTAMRKKAANQWLFQKAGSWGDDLGPAFYSGLPLPDNISRLYKRTVPKPKTYLQRIQDGMQTTPNPNLGLSPGTPNFIDKVGMNVREGQEWLIRRAELAKQYFKTGTKKKGDLRSLSAEDYEGMISDVQSQINSISKIPIKNQTVAQKTLKKKLIRDKDNLLKELKYYDSFMNTGPPLHGDPNDVIMYGKSGWSAANPESTMASLKDQVPGWVAQAHKSTDWHHWSLNELTTPLNRRMRELIRLGKAMPNDELNLHAFTWLKGRTYGSRFSGGKGLENTAHQAIHKVGASSDELARNLIKEGPIIEPSISPFSNKPALFKPSNVKVADWKVIKEANLDLNNYDIERIMAVADSTGNLPFAIQKLKEFKFDSNGNISRIYELQGPDGLSEMQRFSKRISKANSADEILALAMELDETLTQPLSEMMDWANDYAINIGAVELMKYTHKPKEFYKDAAEWYMRQLDLEDFKLQEKIYDASKQ